jgi:hypothetical protein
MSEQVKCPNAKRVARQMSADQASVNNIGAAEKTDLI